MLADERPQGMGLFTAQLPDGSDRSFAQEVRGDDRARPARRSGRFRLGVGERAPRVVRRLPPVTAPDARRVHDGDRTDRARHRRRADAAARSAPPRRGHRRRGPARRAEVGILGLGNGSQEEEFGCSAARRPTAGCGPRRRSSSAPRVERPPLLVRGPDPPLRPGEGDAAPGAGRGTADRARRVRATGRRARRPARRRVRHRRDRSGRASREPRPHRRGRGDGGPGPDRVVDRPAPERVRLAGRRRVARA